MGLQLMFETFNVTNRANFFAYNGNTLTPETLRHPPRRTIRGRCSSESA